MVFYEAPFFSSVRCEYFDETSFALLQQALQSQPRLGVVIQGTGGIRKMRWRDPLHGRGKRGGLRVIYYFLDDEEQIYLLTVYRKNEMTDLTPEHKRALRKMIQEEKLARQTKQ